jgi:hypothetical protein
MRPFPQAVQNFEEPSFMQKRQESGVHSVFVVNGRRRMIEAVKNFLSFLGVGLFVIF